MLKFHLQQQQRQLLTLFANVRWQAVDGSSWASGRCLLSGLDNLTLFRCPRSFIHALDLLSGRAPDHAFPIPFSLFAPVQILIGNCGKHRKPYLTCSEQRGKGEGKAGSNKRQNGFPTTRPSLRFQCSCPSPLSVGPSLLSAYKSQARSCPLNETYLSSYMYSYMCISLDGLVRAGEPREYPNCYDLSPRVITTQGKGRRKGDVYNPSPFLQ